MYSSKYSKEELINDDSKLKEVEKNNNAYVKMLNNPEYIKAMGYKK